MHASKGLEWPIVVPINAMGLPRKVSPAVVDRTSGHLYLSMFDVSPNGYETASTAEKAEIDRERVRLWYVTATRARELLVLPRANIPAGKSSWLGYVVLALDDLPALDLVHYPRRDPAGLGQRDQHPRPARNSKRRRRQSPIGTRTPRRTAVSLAKSWRLGDFGLL